MGADDLVAPWLRYVAANVRRLRQRRGLTQEQLAAGAGIAARYLQEVERARTNMTLSMLVAIAHALEVDPRQLLKPAVLPESPPGRPRK